MCWLLPDLIAWEHGGGGPRSWDLKPREALDELGSDRHVHLESEPEDATCSISISPSKTLSFK